MDNEAKVEACFYDYVTGRGEDIILLGSAVSIMEFSEGFVFSVYRWMGSVIGAYSVLTDWWSFSSIY